MHEQEEGELVVACQTPEFVIGATATSFGIVEYWMWILRHTRKVWPGTKKSQATASLNIVGKAIKIALSSRGGGDDERHEDDDENKATSAGGDVVSPAVNEDTLRVACPAVLYGIMIEPVKEGASRLLKSFLPSLIPAPMSSSLADFISEAPVDGEIVVLDVLGTVFGLGEGDFFAPCSQDSVLENLLLTLSAAYAGSGWSKHVVHVVFQSAILKLVEEAPGGREFLGSMSFSS